MDKISTEKAMKELTMILMYLSRFRDNDDFPSDLDMAWKGYNFDIINKLDEEKYIRKGSYRSKSVVITENGARLAQNLLDKYNIKDWE